MRPQINQIGPFRIIRDHSWMVPCCRVLGIDLWTRMRSYRIIWKRGAGYIGGLSAYFVVMGQDRRPAPVGNIYRRRFLQVGITTNASRVPYVAH